MIKKIIIIALLIFFAIWAYSIVSSQKAEGFMEPILEKFLGPYHHESSENTGVNIDTDFENLVFYA